MPILPGAIPSAIKSLYLFGNADHFLSLCFIFFYNRLMGQLTG